MAYRMIEKLSDYIVSPLALGTHENYECVKAGKTMLCEYEGKWGIPGSFVASMMDEMVLLKACERERIPVTSYTKFERMVILSVIGALRSASIDPRSSEVLFIIASTKGNIELLDERQGNVYPSERVLLTESARQITKWFHNPNEPLVVCNACISGLSAQIEACRILAANLYRYVIVVGADVLSPFIISGFQSFKAVSPGLCRPFDEDRIGLNLGEAAACVIYGEVVNNPLAQGTWVATNGSIRNDAYHISSPSKTADGAYRALRSTIEVQDISNIAFINVHGTATLFNDEMESIAIGRLGMEHIPANGLKGYFGHTLGASGVLETLISMEAVEDHTVLATKGFEHIGVSRNINLSDTHRETKGSSFLKMMSGFGGCNAAMLFRRYENIPIEWRFAVPYSYNTTHTIHLTEREASVDGMEIRTEASGMSLLKYLYQTHIRDYPKFYKMDPLCKVGFIASELLLEAESRAEGVERFVEREDRAVIFVGYSGSLCADRRYQDTIQHTDDYYPSPSAFIYTLPNILTGEVAIRNHYHGETSFFMRDSGSDVRALMERALRSPGTRSVIGGWIEIQDENRFEATLYIIK